MSSGLFSAVAPYRPDDCAPWPVRTVSPDVRSAVTWLPSGVRCGASFSSPHSTRIPRATLPLDNGRAYFSPRR
jgi:hypothetical protein